MTATKTRVDVDKATFEPGIVLDGSIDSAEALDAAIAAFADSVLTGTRYGDEASAMLALIRGGLDDDTADPWEALHEIADEAVAALNDATPEGYHWSVDDNSLFLLPTEED